MLSPGAASLLTRAQRAHWEWREPIDVTHLYLDPALVNAVADEVLHCHVSDVRLEDVLRTDDPVITATVAAVAAEARQQALGGPLYVESLARGLIVHLLRRYASIERAKRVPAAGLSPRQRRAIVEYVEANLGEALTLEGMGAELGLGACSFSRAFRRSFGMPPYAYLIVRRIERARKMLVETMEPIKAIAVTCGFTDQTHLTRLFSRELGATPGRVAPIGPVGGRAAALAALPFPPGRPPRRNCPDRIGKPVSSQTPAAFRLRFFKPFPSDGLSLG